MRFDVRQILTVALLGPLPFTAEAVGLGELRVLSALGERFHGEIPILNTSGPISQGCFHLTESSPGAIPEAPWLANAHVSVLTDPPRLKISTRKQVLDPVAQLAIYTGCGNYLTRHYVALLSPPKEPSAAEPTALRPPETLSTSLPPAASAPAPAPAPAKESSRSASRRASVAAMPGETASGMARRLYPRSEAAQKRFVSQMVALNPEWLTSTAGDEPLPEGVELNYPPPPSRRKKTERASSPVSNDRLVLSANEPLQLRLDVELPHVQPASSVSAPTGGEISARIYDVEQQIKAARVQIEALKGEYPAPPPAIRALIAELETRLVTIELNVARVDLANLEGEKKLAEAPAEAVPVLAKTEIPVDKKMTVEAPVASALPVEKAQSAEASGGTGGGTLVLGILGLGAALGVLLHRRRGKRNEGLLQTGAVAEEPDSQTSLEERRMPVSQTVLAASSELEHAISEDKTGGIHVVHDPEELEHPVEVADIMLIYGQTQEAMDVLRSFMEAHPGQSLRVAKRLLELYKQLGMKEEFEMLAVQTCSQYGLPLMSWNE